MDFSVPSPFLARGRNCPSPAPNIERFPSVTSPGDSRLRCILFWTMKYLLALDEGTTSARAVLYDRDGRRAAMEAQPVECRYPHSGWVEQDARQLLDRQIDSTRVLLSRLSISANDIAAVGITNQRESVVVWDRESGAPLAPAINWQCRRTARFCEELARSADAGLITSKTGLIIDAYFSASKIRWILDGNRDIRRKAENGDALFG